MNSNSGNICFDNIRTGGKRTIWLWISCIFFISIVAAQDNFRPNSRYGKREDPLLSKYKTTVFQAGGRFGRSEGRQPKNGLDSKLFIMPRVDRLYFGSRYGKRSELEEPRVESLETIDELVDRIEKKLLLDSELLRKILYPRGCNDRDDC